MNESISLTELESKIFKYLLDTCHTLGLKDTVLRVAGGWVRDKVLGSQSDDIDIALNNMTGAEFCEKIQTQNSSLNYAVIRSNPEQSKHLETATMKLFGQEIDFANLRTEEYSSLNRIPTMKMGTTTEDALRRDFTINTLFYNVNTGQIEDLTKSGLSDLRNGIIRTPLEPKQTFLDDPLRILRCVRFATRYNFSIDEKIFEAIKSTKAIYQALEKKVSRERFCIELRKMLLKGRDPIGAISCIFEMGIHDIVFSLSTEGEGKKKKKKRKKGVIREYENPVGIAWKNVKNSICRMRVVHHFMKILSDDRQFGENEKLALYFASLLSNFDFCDKEKKEKEKESSTSPNISFARLLDFCENLFVSSLKFPRQLSRDVAILLDQCFSLHGLVWKECSEEEEEERKIVSSKLVIGKTLRKSKNLFFCGLLLCEVMGIGIAHVDERAFLGYLRGDRTGWRCVRFWRAIKKLRMDELMNMKPLVNGKEVQTLLEIKPSKKIKVVLDAVMEYQIVNHPNCTKQQVTDFILKNFK